MPSNFFMMRRFNSSGMTDDEEEDDEERDLTANFPIVVVVVWRHDHKVCLRSSTRQQKTRQGVDKTHAIPKTTTTTKTTFSPPPVVRRPMLRRGLGSIHDGNAYFFLLACVSPCRVYGVDNATQCRMFVLSSLL
jgi:hypothetical protein